MHTFIVKSVSIKMGVYVYNKTGCQKRNTSCVPLCVV